MPEPTTTVGREFLRFREGDGADGVVVGYDEISNMDGSLDSSKIIGYRAGVRRRP